MTKLPDTFAVFILTHGRPNNIKTLKSLKRSGYAGKLYLIVDNEDKKVDKYIRSYGKDMVVVFDKKAEADLCDEGNNFDERRTITMARNACFKIAESLGITHFVELDDDYSSFSLRYDEGAKIINDINSVFKYILDFYENTNILSIAFSQGGDHIGGFCGEMLKRKCMNSFLCSTKRPFRFIGAMNEDVNTYTTLGSRGSLFFTITSVQLTQQPTQTQAGGISDMYLRYGTYCKAFTTVMMMPSSVKVSMMNTKNERLHHSINWVNTVPCIIQEKHRKEI